MGKTSDLCPSGRRKRGYRIYLLVWVALAGGGRGTKLAGRLKPCAVYQSFSFGHYTLCADSCLCSALALRRANHSLARASIYRRLSMLPLAYLSFWPCHSSSRMIWLYRSSPTPVL
jgi:hypothetical protein